MKTALYFVKYLVLPVVLVCCFSFLVDAQTETQDYAEAGNEFFEKGLYDSAIRSFKMALENLPAMCLLYAVSGSHTFG